MKRFEMIKDKNYFNFIIKNGKFIKDNNFVIYYIYNEKKNFPQFGIAIKNSIGKAVERNHLKRQVRNLIDNNKKLFKNECDYIIMIRDGCTRSSFEEKNSSLVNLLERKIINEKK